MAKDVDGDQRVMAAAQQILRSLGTSRNVKEDMIFILSNFGERFSAINNMLSKNVKLDAAEEVIYNWESSPSVQRNTRFLFSEDCGDAAKTYLSAVDEIVELWVEFSRIGESGEIRDRTETLLQVAMSRLEEEFRHILVKNSNPLDSQLISGSAHRFSMSSDPTDIGISDLEISVGAETIWHEREKSLGDVSIDLMNSNAIIDLNNIATRMIAADYEKECCQVYISVRRDVLDEHLLALGMEKLGIEEVQKIDWSSLDEKMKKWCQVVKVVIRVILSKEKWLCDQIFADSSLITEVCFGEISKGCVMQLMTFAEAISIGRWSSEKLFRILDMYDALADLLPDLNKLYIDDLGKFVCKEGELVCGEVQGILVNLGLAAKGTLAEFENAIQKENSRKPVQGGDIHPLARYVMNYVKLVVDYSDTLEKLLKNNDYTGSLDGDGNGDDLESGALARRILLLISSLESNLEDKSKLYEDKAIKYVFLMNNIHYIVQKVKGSELGKLLGDQWIRKHRGQIRQFATCYLRACWSKVLSCLKDEGAGSSGHSSNISKTALKDKFRNFNLCFEEVYKTQTAWKVPDPQLREELRISISEKVIPAYRSFFGRFRSQVESGRHSGKYVKYTPEDLENYLSDFFEGNSVVMHHPRRRSG